MPVTVALASLLVFGVGCKQDVGERCEQNTDCSSGFCNGMGAASPGICTNGEGTTTPVIDAGNPTPDAATMKDAPSDFGADAKSGDAAADSASDAARVDGSDGSADGAVEVHVEAGGDVGVIEAGTASDAASGG
ncbi:MAG TPA: hypothetical protein VH560_15060 [Polyangia bacterium]|nr:hypothetical protein [Polyangia bacterium]